MAFGAKQTNFFERVLFSRIFYLRRSLGFDLSALFLVFQRFFFESFFALIWCSKSKKRLTRLCTAPKFNGCNLLYHFAVFFLFFPGFLHYLVENTVFRYLKFHVLLLAGF